MKSFILLFSLVILFASCTTAYKSGQTPDDVYFSPERPVEEYVRVDNNRNRETYREYRNEEEMYDERYLRMKIRNRMWSVLDDEWYSYNPYIRHHDNYMAYNSAWNRYNYWNCFYNPYGRNTVFIGGSNTVYNRPRQHNLFVFGGNTNNKNPNIPKGNRGSNVTYRDNTENYRGSGSNAGNYLRDIFGSSGSSSNSNTTKGSSSSSSSGSSSSGSSSSGSGSSGNAPVRKF